MANPIYSTGKKVGSSLGEKLVQAGESRAVNIKNKLDEVLDMVEAEVGATPKMVEQQEIIADLQAGLEPAEAVNRSLRRLEGKPTVGGPGDAPRPPMQGPEDTGFYVEPEDMSRPSPFMLDEQTPDVPESIGREPSVTVNEDELAVAPAMSADADVSAAPGGTNVRAMESADSRSRKAGKGSIATALLGGGSLAAGVAMKGAEGETPTTPDELLTAQEEGRQQAKKEMVDEQAEDIAKSVKAKLDGYVPPSLAIQTLPRNIASGGPQAVLETAPEYSQAVESIEEEGKRFATTPEGKTYAEQLGDQDKTILAEWNNRKKELKELYKETKERIGWAQAAELLGSALVQLGAGLYGLRTGVDMTGMKFNFNDWNKNYERALDEHRLELSNLEDETKAKRDIVETERKTYDDWTRRLESARNRLAEAAQTTDQFNISQANQQQRENVNNLLEILKFNATQQNDAAMAKWRAEVDAPGKSDRTLTDMQKSLAQSMFTKEFTDVQAASKNYAEGIAALKQAALTSDDKEKERLVKLGIQNVGPYLQDPTGIVKLQEDATKKGWAWLDDEVDFNKLVETLNTAPKKAEPNPGDYLPGGTKWPAVQTGERTLQEATGGGQQQAAPTIKARHKQSGMEKMVTQDEWNRLPKDQFEQVIGK